MAKAISQRIALEGAEELKRQLAQVGQIGERSFEQLRRSAGAVGLKTVKNDTAGLASETTRLAGSVQQVDGSLKSYGNTASQTASSVRDLAKTMAVLSAGLIAAGAAILKMAQSAASAAADIGKAATKANVELGDFQKSQFILKQLGLNAGEAEQAIKKVGEVGKAAFEKGQEALKKLGIVFPDTEEGAAKAAKRMEDLSKVSINGKKVIDEETGALAKFHKGLNPENLKAFADQLKRMKDEAGQQKLAETLFGPEIGRQLLPGLLKGGEAIEGLLKRFKDLRLGVNATDVEIGQKFVAAMAEFSDASRKGRTELGLLFAPIATSTITAWTDLIRQNREMLAGSAETIKLSVSVALQDLFRLLKEGSGAQVNTAWLATLRDGLVAVGEIITNVIRPAFETLKAGATAIAAAINQAFGTQLTAADVGIAGVITFLIGGLNTLGIAILALFADKAPAAVQKFKDSLLSFGINIDAIKASVSGFFKQLGADLKAITEGRTGDVQFTWLITLKEALTSLPVVLAEVGAALGLLLRLAATRPAVALTAFILNLTGLLPILTFAINSLVAAMSLLVGILTVIGFAFGATAAAIAGLVVIFAAVGVAIYLFWDEIKAGAAGADEAIRAAFDGIETYIAEKFKAMMEAAKAAWEYIKKLFNSPIGKGSETPVPSIGDITGGAGGGSVRGAGTGTSDSILARLSNGEFVMRAAAVRHYGPALMAAINSMRFAKGGPVPGFAAGGQAQQGAQQLFERAMEAGLRAAEATNKAMQEHHKAISEILNNLMQAFTGGIGGIQIGFGPGPVNQLARGGLVGGRGVPGFSMGGLVNALAPMLPGLAGGGLVPAPSQAARSLHPVTINMPGGGGVGGLLAPPSVVDRLEREVLLKSSAGRAPSWRGR